MKTAKAKPAAPPPARPTRWLWPGVAGALFLVAYLAYGPALGGPFVFDDTYLPMMDPRMAGAPFRSWLGVRPVTMTSYWLNHEMSGLEPYAYHLTNLLLHFVSAAMVAAVAYRLLEWAETPARLRPLLAAFAGGLFLLHPAQTEAVAYVSSRSESLSVACYYAALAAFVWRPRPSVRWGRALLILGLFVLACLSKEHAVTLPALLLLTDVLFHPYGPVRGPRANWRVYAPVALGALAAVAFVLRALQGASSAGFGVKGVTWQQYLYTQFRAIWAYVRVFVLPADLNVDRDFPLTRTLAEWDALAGLVALLAVVGLAWVYRKRFPLAAWGALAFLLLLAPTSSVVPIQDTMVERRLYLPFVGLTMVLLEGLRRLNVTRATLAGSLGAVLVLCTVLTYQRNQVWSSPVLLWQDTVAKSPQKARPRLQLAYAYFRAGLCQEAVEQYGVAAQRQPEDYGLMLNWGLALECAQQPEAAAGKLVRATTLAQPEHGAHAHASLGMVYAKGKQPEKAAEALERALAINPQYDVAYAYRGNVRVMQAQYGEAVNDFRRALELNPDNVVARQGLALLQRRQAGR